MQKLLLHTCCAICAIGALSKSDIQNYSVSFYFYNPNINTKEEYLKRANELKKLCVEFDIDKIIIEPYKLGMPKSNQEDSFVEKGEKCRICISHRLQKTAEFAINNNYNIFTTTLTTSPHKDAKFINKTGEEITIQHYINSTSSQKITYLTADFKKQNGFLIATQIAKKLNLYRQSFCGCTPR
ncbi:MAG: epoxyqueuosine reductase QueH [Firmicutes bacterium]|nr:epoxyqueuosine reductase QueH [Bacillota bacterium]